VSELKQHHDEFDAPFAPCPYGKASQTPLVKMYYMLTLKANPDGSKSVMLQLSGDGNTMFDPGILLLDSQDEDDQRAQEKKDKTRPVGLAWAGRGYYCDQLTVKITCDSPGMLFKHTFPTTDNQNGDVDLSTSLSAGFFGKTITANISTTKSVTRSIQDFVMKDHSDITLLWHVYDLKMCADGTPYVGPSSVNATSPVSWGTFRPLPELATSDFSLNELVVLDTPVDGKYPDQFTLTVSVLANMQMIANSAGNAVEIKTHPRLINAAEIKVDLSEVIF
jgi:hypothetical protein